MAAKLMKIVTHLWYNTQAIEAAKYYVSLFPGSEIRGITKIRNTPTGDVDVVYFSLSGMDFVAISAGPMFKLNESVSFMVYCDTQEEIDHYWEKLSAGGEQQPCGWLKDKFGLSWQVVPAAMETMMRSNDKDGLARMFGVMSVMGKLDIKKLEDAFYNR